MTAVHRMSPSAEGEAIAVRVRQATPRDLETVVALRLALLLEHRDHPIYGRLRGDADARARELFAGQLRSTMEAIFLAERGGDAVGVLRCVESPGSLLLEPAHYAYVSSAYVRPVARRRGVLRALLAAADGWARARGLSEMRLHNVAGSAEAEGAWSALGFSVVEQVRVRQIDAPSRAR